MRLPDAQKRRLICATAARLFASQPFHKVRLEDVAAAAGVGKGTLYVYFRNKQDLYVSLVQEGFIRLIERLRTQLAEPTLTAMARLELIVGELVDFSHRHSHLAELMRTAPPPRAGSAWDRRRRELTALITDTICRGVRSGELCDPHPELTALFIPGLVRSAVLFGPAGLGPRVLKRHILRILSGGIAKEDL